MKNWLAPAKLNLFLHVLGQRDDGFHELQTLFQLLDFGDNLSFEITSDGRVERSDNPGLPEDDLTILAARALKSYSHCELGVKISLDKRIPLGAGLGGGREPRRERAAGARRARTGRAVGARGDGPRGSRDRPPRGGIESAARCTGRHVDRWPA